MTLGVVSKARTMEQAQAMLADRLDGMSMVEVAERHGVGRATAYRRIDQATRAIPAAEVERYRELERVRLEEVADAVERQYAVAAELGRLGSLSEDAELIEKAVNLLDKANGRKIQLSDRWSRLMGLDAPQRSEVTVTVQTDLDREMSALADEVRKALPA